MHTPWLSLITLWLVMPNALRSQSVPYDVGQTEIILPIDASTSVKGTRSSVLGDSVDSFLGIPFAQPPVGDMRYKRPVPYTGPSWTGEFDATRQPNSCPQTLDNEFGRHPGVEMWNANTKLDEDCLYLNIWVPFPKSSEKFAVMIWIYGGSFMTGTSTLAVYDGRTLAAKTKVIVVSLQYRLGPLGFAYLGTDDIPGNVGLLDQQAAIQWVYNNIEHFGGDKDRITLFGESAGSVSVSYHMLSQKSWPYFNRAILQSGSASATWAYQSPDVAKRKTIKFAEIVGCKTKGVTLEAISKCLISKDKTDIVNHQWDLVNMYFDVPMAPTLDGYFINEPPMESIKKKKIKNADLLAGGNRDEGMYFLLYGLPKYFNLKNENPLNREEFLRVLDRVAPTNVTLVHEAVVFQYEKSVAQHSSNKYRDILDDIAGDTNFVCPTVDFVQAAYRDEKQTFMYHFKHRSNNNPWPEWMGVLHGYEIEFVFGDPLNKSLNYTAEDLDISRRMMVYWSNFAKSGNPNRGESVSKEWPRYTPSKREYFVLDTTPGRTEYGLRHRYCSFWKELVPEMYSYAERVRGVCGISGGVFHSSSDYLLMMTAIACVLLYGFR
ncbi:cholinesterase [Lingula anatina]|uniref:Carboxylic ester hydrolase n=1 Tax=Lingula anatina TaxID=7574 RepID=A0A1S3KF66_LINAN|nr:cholinesterase [Lingula anatina]XP_013421278.1 cholinesterase [Lingula anatina]XP_013421279.1 cholinesterase [Lingula anatina]XP_023931634.1 cholinesterase [Lingula anatina]XP_023931635.1 cholinesterase [Lingula anatina]|eukprot:XP_013421277.1 cholinesterase [Lingula anatina]